MEIVAGKYSIRKIAVGNDLISSVYIGMNKIWEYDPYYQIQVNIEYTESAEMYKDELNFYATDNSGSEIYLGAKDQFFLDAGSNQQYTINAYIGGYPEYNDRIKLSVNYIDTKTSPEQITIVVDLLPYRQVYIEYQIDEGIENPKFKIFITIEADDGSILYDGYEDGTSVINLEVVDGSRISVRSSVVEEETDPSLFITVPNYEDVLIISDYAIEVFISKAN